MPLDHLAQRRGHLRVELGARAAVDLFRIAKGERQVVLDYFELCRKFWQMHDGRLDKWSQQVQDGKIPDFGANLVY